MLFGQHFRHTLKEDCLAHTAGRMDEKGLAEFRNESRHSTQLFAQDDLADVRETSWAWKEVFDSLQIQCVNDIGAPYDIGTLTGGPRFISNQLAHSSEASPCDSIRGRCPVNQDSRKFTLFLSQRARKARNAHLFRKGDETCSFEAAR